MSRVAYSHGGLDGQNRGEIPREVSAEAPVRACGTPSPEHVVVSCGIKLPGRLPLRGGADGTAPCLPAQVSREEAPASRLAERCNLPGCQTAECRTCLLLRWNGDKDVGTRALRRLGRGRN